MTTRAERRDECHTAYTGTRSSWVSGAREKRGHEGSRPTRESPYFLPFLPIAPRRLRSLRCPSVGRSSGAAIQAAYRDGERHMQSSAAVVSDPLLLHWSSRGEVACDLHAPAPDSPRWRDERWQPVPAFVSSKSRKPLQCQHCPTGGGRPYRHMSLSDPSREHAVREWMVRECDALLERIEILGRLHDESVRHRGDRVDASATLVRSPIETIRALLEGIRDRTT